MARLIGIYPLTAISFPGVRAMQLASIEVGKGSLSDWRVSVRGPSVFFESPPGWTPNGPAAGTKRRVYEVSRADMRLAWELDDGEAVPVNYAPVSGIAEAPADSPPAATAEHAPLARVPETVSIPIEASDPDDPDDLPIVTKGKRR